MNHDIRFQMMMLPNAPWDELLKRIHLAETLGFDVIATADHFVDWSNPPSPWFELPTLLGAMARETSTITIASCVAQIPLRDPATMARQALAIDQMSNGRFELGLGIGLMTDPSYDIMGIPGWTLKERVARFKEYLEIVDKLLCNEVSSYDGEYYQIKDAYMNPRPIHTPRPPITVAAMGPKMLKLAATYADTWNSLSFCETFAEQLAETTQRIERVKSHCETIGRDPGSLRMSYAMFDPGARTSGGMFNYYESEDTFVDIVRQVAALGVTEFSLYYPMKDEQLPKFERTVREVIPRLREELAS
jgi:alkanesulfonate monooxygenase SsuD/methylene tetrahydromethanopterin reductase-like flavin-dependent oxidoreductase (luciferase family)